MFFGGPIPVTNHSIPRYPCRLEVKERVPLNEMTRLVGIFFTRTQDSSSILACLISYARIRQHSYQ